MRKPPVQSDAVRITLQSRTKTGMSYDLRGGGCRVTVNITPLLSKEDGPGWQVEGEAGTPGEKQTVAASARTRAEALKAMGERWASRRLPAFDWEAVAAALSEVRAL